MKKLFITLFFLLCSISSLYSLEITDTDNTLREYFSLGDSVVKVTHTSQETLEVKYVLNSVETIQEYNLTSCESKYCYEIDLLTLFNSNNESTTIPNEFEFSINLESKIIYLDVTKPTITIEDEVINATKNTLEVTYNYSDNSNSIKKVDLYINSGSSFVFEKKVEGNTFTYELSNEDEIEYQLRIEDEAGNTNTISSVVEVGDIYEPSIASFMYTLKDSTFQVVFTVTDETLGRYAFTQGSISLEEDISGKTLTKTVTLPFTKGEVTLNVYDTNGNSVSRTFTLKDDISISSIKRYSNKELFSFTSNADQCYLQEVDGRKDTSKFSKTKSLFESEINVPKFEDVLIEFYCERNGFRKYFEKEFFYDTDSPDPITLSLLEQDNGDIELNWTKSEDEHLDVRYILYRDSDEIYEGSKTKYTDDDVSYPNEYEYYVEVIDLAGNSEESDELNIIPKKMEVRFFVVTTNNQVVQDPKFSLEGALEEGAQLTINVKHNSNLIDTKSLTGSSQNKFVSQVLLQEGLNTIEFNAQDSLGNSKSNYLYVTYEPVQSTVSQETSNENLNQQQENAIEPNDLVIGEQQGGIVQEEVVIEKDSSYWIWLLLFLLLLIVFVIIIVTKEDELRERFKRTSKDVSNHYSKSRKNDLMLGKNLEKAKQERIKRQEEEREKKRKQEELKKKKKESDYQRQKLKELSQKREIHFSEMDRKKAQRRVDKIRRESSYEEELDKLKEEQPKVSLFERVFSKPQQEEKKDELSEYIGDQKQRKSWDDTYSYRASHIEKLKAEEDAKKRAIEEERKLQELKTQEELSRKQAVEEKNKKENDIINRKTSSQEFLTKSKEKRVNLDDYLGQRTKKKRWFFAEKSVEDDLKSRK